MVQKTKTEPKRSPARASGRQATKRRHSVPRLTGRQLSHYRALLMEKRYSLVQDMGGLAAEIADGGNGQGTVCFTLKEDDPAESGWLCEKLDVTACLLANERQMLRDIDDALDRITSRTYGVCEATGQPIHKARLEARPWARYCIEYARQLDRHGLGQPRTSDFGRHDKHTDQDPAEDDLDGFDEEPPDLPVPVGLDLDDDE